MTTPWLESPEVVLERLTKTCFSISVVFAICFSRLFIILGRPSQLLSIHEPPSRSSLQHLFFILNFTFPYLTVFLLHPDDIAWATILSTPPSFPFPRDFPGALSMSRSWGTITTSLLLSMGINYR
eukprot:TRINITY_DN4642_c0_g1_i10.p1 TRINITY_DN4642_c0_g1~~TRINITY_DN4642_c0_g1_i10.p1  ORF type:complete len:125 (-),score=3.90 TRINITY_DN4642_c0_g1_i10:3322-3696(-)